MSELPSQSNHEDNDFSPQSSAEVDAFDMSNLMSAEQHAAIRTQVEEQYAARSANRAVASSDALAEVHSILAGGENTPAEYGREVVVEGKQEVVVDSYLDAKGNEWVELTGGRHTMKHTEIIPEAPAAVEAESREPDTAPSEQDIMTPEAPAEQGDALAVAEAHLQEVLSAKQSESVQVEKTEPEHVSAEQASVEEEAASKSVEAELFKEPSERAERQALDQVQVLQKQLETHADRYKQGGLQEKRRLDEALGALTQVRNGLRRTDGAGVDPILFGHIDTAIREAMETTKGARADEDMKNEQRRLAVDEVQSVDGLSSQQHELLDKLQKIPEAGSLDDIQNVRKMLYNANARDYAYDKNGMIRLLTAAINTLNGVQEANARDNKKFASVVEELRKLS